MSFLRALQWSHKSWAGSSTADLKAAWWSFAQSSAQSQDHLICGVLGSWISHLMKAELLLAV